MYVYATALGTIHTFLTYVLMKIHHFKKGTIDEKHCPFFIELFQYHNILSDTTLEYSISHAYMYLRMYAS